MHKYTYRKNKYQVWVKILSRKTLEKMNEKSDKKKRRKIARKSLKILKNFQIKKSKTTSNKNVKLIPYKNPQKKWREKKWLFFWFYNYIIFCEKNALFLSEFFQKNYSLL